MDIIQPLMDMANGVTISPPALEGQYIPLVLYSVCVHVCVYGIVVLGPNIWCAAFQDISNLFLLVYCIYSSQPSPNTPNCAQRSWACCIPATKFWCLSCCGTVVSVAPRPRGKSITDVSDFGVIASEYMLMFICLCLYQLQRMLQNFQQNDKTLANIFANKTSNQSQMPVAQHSSHAEKKSSLAEVKFVYWC